MTDLGRRVDLAGSWFVSHLSFSGHEKAGWGWVPDVPPNPQNTSEVVCALTAVNRPVPSRHAVESLVRSNLVLHHDDRPWAFHGAIDAAWRLRALQCLGVVPADTDILVLARSLLASQDSATGGWLAGAQGAVSVTTTVAAIRALNLLDIPELKLLEAQRRAVSLLVSMILEDDERTRQVYAKAQIAHLLALSPLSEVGGPRAKRVRKDSIEHIMDALSSDYYGVEEEVFQRDEVTDIWRHTTLYLSLRAVASASPHRIFEPAFRRGLIAMLDLQEISASNIHLGGFRTSRDGFVTSYSTTQALEVLSYLEGSLSKEVSPATAFDLLCQYKGAHHSDSQDIHIGKIHLLLNSVAGVVLLCIGFAAGITISSLAIGFQADLGKIGSRALVVWAFLFPAVGSAFYFCARLPHRSNAKIAAVVFTGFTALVLPVISFLLS